MPNSASLPFSGLHRLLQTLSIQARRCAEEIDGGTRGHLAVQHMATRIDLLTSIVELQATNPALEPQPVDLADLVDGIQKDFALIENATMTSHIVDRPLVALADPAWAPFIVMDLMQSALDLAPRPAHLALATRFDDRGNLALSVTSTLVEDLEADELAERIKEPLTSAPLPAEHEVPALRMARIQMLSNLQGGSFRWDHDKSRSEMVVTLSTIPGV